MLPLKSIKTLMGQDITCRSRIPCTITIPKGTALFLNTVSSRMGITTIAKLDRLNSPKYQELNLPKIGSLKRSRQTSAHSQPTPLK
jgi:hypothetical protein